MTTATRPAAWAHQEKGLEFIRHKPGAMLAMEMGTGKDLDDTTPIPTPEGWTPMGEMKIGQQVFDEQGKPRTVTGVYPQGKRPVYNVIFDDGAVITAGHEHLWVTLAHNRQARTHREKTSREDWALGLTPMTTREIRESLDESVHSIPLAAPLQLPEAALPVDPYRMGLWLRDGSPAQEQRCIAAWTGERQTGGRPGNTMTRGMRDTGVRDNRQIPQRYLRASLEQRTRLLQGLTGGPADPAGTGNVEFTSTSRKLALGVLELAISLGRKATLSQEETMPEGQQVPEKWRVTLPDTRAEGLARSNQRYIQAVEEAGVTSTTCITVDSPSGLFLAGREMAPTHNTKIAVDLMDEMEARRTLVLAPLSVVDHVWPGEIRKHSSRPGLTVVSLGNRVPSTRKKLERAAEGLNLATARRGPAIVIVNYESAWRKPLGQWLKDQHWDLLIMDESHRIKNASGETSRFVSQLSDRSRRRLALTGTPMPHSPLDIYAQYRAIDKSIFGVDHREFTNRYAEFETTSRSTTFINKQGEEETRPGRKISGYQNLDELHRKFYQLAFRVTAAETLDLPSAIETYTRVELNGKTRKLYDQMAASFRAELETGETMTAANALARLTRFQQLTSGFAVTPEGKVMEVDDSKQNALADILEDLPREERLVVFARFQHDLDSIAQVSEKARRSCYEISGRVKNLDEWNRKGGVLAVQLQAGGLGLDLTQARYCVYYSLSFSLGDYLQSIARLHRHGQTRMVDYIHLVAHESIDEIITVALERKEHIIRHILEVRDLTNRNPEK